MTIEQKPELNRLADSSFPITWSKRWRAFKLTLPIWIFILVCLGEMSVVRAWFANRLSWDFLSSLVGGLFGGFTVLWGIIEFQIWFEGRSKRILRVKDKHLIVSPAKHQYIRFKSVAQFQFEPVAEKPSLTKLSIFEHSSKRVPLRRRFVMIIESPAQVRELVQTLEVKRQTVGKDFKIVTLNQPQPPPAGAKFPLAASMSITFTGFYLILHGLPLIGIALLPREHDSSSNLVIDPEQAAKVGQFFAAHFSSVEQLRHFYLGAGSALTIAGLALIIWRMRLDGRKPCA